MGVDFTHPYITRQLIAYLGNKRRLLPRLSAAFDLLAEQAPIRSFVDPFSGSGSVARLAKLKGYTVRANDWEPFSYVVNAAHITTDPSWLEHAYSGWGGIGSVIDEINAATDVVEGTFSRLYAPRSTDAPDPQSERLFYTRENALFLDRGRRLIEERYPGWDLEDRSYREKLLLLSLLVYEAATHANTSGVFKAFYKGFGGYGRDALARIMSPMSLEFPVLIPGPACTAGCEDASDFVSRYTSDLCYLDPPYNQHQYGSNYHILNTVVLGDEPPIGTRDARAGIRTDWVRTRSDFCSRRSANSAFRRLLDKIDARFVVLSYNTEGTCGLEELFDLLSVRGTVRILSDEYVKFRGGRQSIERKTHNQEILFLLDAKRELPGADIRELRRRVDERDVYTLIDRPLHPERASSRFRRVDGRLILVRNERVEISLPVDELPLRRTASENIDLSALDPGELGELRNRLIAAAFENRQEEVESLCDLLLDGMPQELSGRAVSQLLNALKKFAHLKYREEFEITTKRLIGVARSNPGRFPGIEKGVAEITRIAEKRFSRG